MYIEQNEEENKSASAFKLILTCNTRCTNTHTYYRPSSSSTYGGHGVVAVNGVFLDSMWVADAAPLDGVAAKGTAFISQSVSLGCSHCAQLRVRLH